MTSLRRKRRPREDLSIDAPARALRSHILTAFDSGDAISSQTACRLQLLRSFTARQSTERKESNHTPALRSSQAIYLSLKRHLSRTVQNIQALWPHCPDHVSQHRVYSLLVRISHVWEGAILRIQVAAISIPGVREATPSQTPRN